MNESKLIYVTYQTFPSEKANTTPSSTAAEINPASGSVIGISRNGSNDNDFADKTKRETVLHQIWKMAIYGDMRSINLLAELGCLNEKD